MVVDYRVNCQNIHAVVSSDKEFDDRQIQLQCKWGKNSLGFIIQIQMSSEFHNVFFFFIICKGLFLHVIWLTAASFIRTVKKQQHCLLFLLGYWQRRASLIYVLLHIFTSAKVGAKRLRNSSECESGMVDGISLIACYYGAMRVFAFFASTVTHQSPASTKPSTETNIHGEVFLLLKFVLHVTHFLL